MRNLTRRLLPLALGATGIWLANPAAEILALLTMVPFLLHWIRRERRGDLPDPEEEDTARN